MTTKTWLVTMGLIGLLGVTSGTANVLAQDDDGNLEGSILGPQGGYPAGDAKQLGGSGGGYPAGEGKIPKASTGGYPAGEGAAIPGASTGGYPAGDGPLLGGRAQLGEDDDDEDEE